MHVNVYWDFPYDLYWYLTNYVHWYLQQLSHDQGYRNLFNHLHFPNDLHLLDYFPDHLHGNLQQLSNHHSYWHFLNHFHLFYDLNDSRLHLFLVFFALYFISLRTAMVECPELYRELHQGNFPLPDLHGNLQQPHHYNFLPPHQIHGYLHQSYFRLLLIVGQDVGFGHLERYHLYWDLYYFSGLLPYGLQLHWDL